MFVKGPHDFFQARQRSLQIRLRVRARIHFLCVSTIQHAQYEEIETDCAGSEDNLQVAVVERGTKRDTLSEAVVSLRTLVTFVMWLISRTECSSSELVL